MKRQAMALFFAVVAGFGAQHTLKVDLGGAKIERLEVEGQTVTLPATCKERGVCTLSVEIEPKSSYTLAAGGERVSCAPMQPCNVAGAQVLIEPSGALTLADGSLDLQQQLDALLDQLLQKEQLTDSDVTQLTSLLDKLKAWKKPLGSDTLSKLMQLKQKFPQLPIDPKSFLKIPMIG